MYLNDIGNWSAVCHCHPFSSNVAEVVCRQLGLPVARAYGSSSSSFFEEDSLRIEDDYEPIPQIIVQCFGTENSLNECTHTRRLVDASYSSISELYCEDSYLEVICGEMSIFYSALLV